PPPPPPAGNLARGGLAVVFARGVPADGAAMIDGSLTTAASPGYATCEGSSFSGTYQCVAGAIATVTLANPSVVGSVKLFSGQIPEAAHALSFTVDLLDGNGNVLASGSGDSANGIGTVTFPQSKDLSV